MRTVWEAGTSCGMWWISCGKTLLRRYTRGGVEDTQLTRRERRVECPGRQVCHEIEKTGVVVTSCLLASKSIGND